MRNPIWSALAAVLVATMAGGCSSPQTDEEATSIAAFGVDGAAGRYVVTSGYEVADKLYWEQHGRRTEVAVTGADCDRPWLVLVPVASDQAGLVARCDGGASTVFDLRPGSLTIRLRSVELTEAAWRAGDAVTYGIDSSGGAVVRFRDGGTAFDGLVDVGGTTVWKPGFRSASGPMKGILIAVGDNGRLVMASEGNTISAVDAYSGRTLWSVADFVWIAGLTFVGPDRIVASALRDGTTALWEFDATTGAVRMIRETSMSRIASANRPGAVLDPDAIVVTL